MVQQVRQLSRLTNRLSDRRASRLSNTAINVLGVREFNRYVNRVEQDTYDSSNSMRTTRQASRVIYRSLLSRTPFVTGNLASSLRVNVQRSRSTTIISITYNAIYANRVNRTSRRNRNFIQRGLRDAIRRLNNPYKMALQNALQNIDAAGHSAIGRASGFNLTGAANGRNRRRRLSR